MIVRRTFWGILLVLMVGVIGGIWTRSGVYVRLLYFGILLIAVSWVWAVLSVRGFIVKRYSRSFRQQLGEVFEERYEVINQYAFLRTWLEIRDLSPLTGSGGSRVLSWIGARETRSYNAYTLLTRRGEFLLGPIQIYSGDPFGLFLMKKEFPGEKKLVVLPFLVDLKSFPFPPGLLPGGRAIRSRTPEVTPHAATVREYAPADSLNRIHWPTTARRDRLMVKEFEQDPQADVWVFLDAQESVKVSRDDESKPPKVDQFWLWKNRYEVTLPSDTFEYSVSIAATVAKYFIYHGQGVGFASAGQMLTVISAERSTRQLSKILETLAFIKSEGQLPLLGLIEAQIPNLSRGSTAVLITSSRSESVIVATEGLVQRGMRPVVLLVDPISFGGASGNEHIVLGLRSRKVPVAVISKGTSLASTLESGFVGGRSSYRS
jgi:uncharacterized protein (DUF58 family)